MNQLLTFLILFITWVIFSGVIDLFHLSLGAISCGIVTWLSSDFLFRNDCKGIGTRFVEAGRFLLYCFWLLWQIILANIHVLKLALASNNQEMRPQMVRFRTSLRSEFARYVFANSITLTPGTVTLSVEGDKFVVHAISQKVADELPGEMEKRVAKIFDQE
ncbi:MAG: Na+/H+ antiporter subunit E [Opitutae bacterium]|nr:Na+/H+ antiporter subunit E [Opitutae bacterium]